jgi:serine/threonine-protein kinase
MPRETGTAVAASDSMGGKLERMTETQTTTGTVLSSRYRLEHPLGEGGMGRLFAAVDQQLGRRVAIKLIREDVDEPSSRDRVLREARAAAVLSHPHACQLFEVGEHDGFPFLVMELLDGEPLSTRLERGPMSKGEAADVILPLMDALSAFHKAGLIHRDLKPANVFLTSQGVKLLDFGLARRTPRSDAVTVPALTVPGAITGTMRYMAPEQLTGDPIDARTDIFAVGVMLFEMLTGRVPFGSGSNVDWLNAVLTEDPPALGTRELQALDSVVERALQRQPADRFTTIDEMAEALRQALHGEGEAPATRESRPARPQKSDAVRAVILPFRLLQDDPEVAALKEGVPDMLTTMLTGKAPWEFLSNRVAQDFAEEHDLMAVGRALRVDRLLTGSILRAGDELQVTVQLVDASDGSVQWSQASRFTVQSVLSLQEEICKKIVDELPLASESAGALP